MDIQIGLNCANQALCEQVGVIFGYSFLALFIGFVAYLIIAVIKSKK